MPDVLFLFAHQDDEYSAAPWIVEERANGANVACLYLTDGGVRVAPEVRDRESRRALASLGVGSGSVVFLAAPDGRIGDGRLAERSADGMAALERWLAAAAFEPERVYAPAYEGGHPDHDAAHVIAALAAARRGNADRCWHFALYNAYRRRPPFFSSLRQLPTAALSRGTTLPFVTRLELGVLCRYYRSQARTWIGLFPQAFAERVILGRECVVQFAADKLQSRPHDGQLLYERMFGVTYEAVAQALRPLIAELCARNA